MSAIPFISESASMRFLPASCRLSTCSKWSEPAIYRCFLSRTIVPGASAVAALSVGVAW